MKKKMVSAFVMMGITGFGATTVEADTVEVEQGDSLWKIASTNGISVDQLMAWNDLAATTIHPGQKLRVKEETGVTASPSPSSPSVYEVEAGDYLSKIAGTYDTTVRQLKKWNNLTSDTIYVGQKLKLSGSGTVQKEEKPVASPTPGPSHTYIVRRGDSLSKIAQTLGMRVKDLKKWNDLETDTIHVGQALQVTKGTSAPKPSHEEEKVSVTSYEVQPGESLWTISQKFKVPVPALRELNNLKDTTIRVGQRLLLEKTKENHQEATSSFPASDIISTAKVHMGVPYVWGGNTPEEGFDCSGFLKYAFGKNGVSIPRTVASIHQQGTPVSSPSIGDLVFFETYKKGPSHAGIYLGDDMFIHAGSSSGVTVSSMDMNYWKTRYLGARSY
ncbi:C40 family peptidase [Salimicrobium halophilum]|uniref:D-gamma-glutamyl-meso-diaminopimelic acid endopeptidase CwlS n=1 Tax=Salimicrobium halophilum TaxID=86666 RepID=A0A1G8SQW0_9BACI|nr:peptidoglycan endopeptidase [Salimicrobium halophilum]SDJ31611.1 D-gamma-glutamyl-meso-diaminopimelic acid endopeptidase CwlS [Salimicrobium halophilum]